MHIIVCYRAEQVSSSRSDVQQLVVVCLYAAMGHEQQLQVFQPAPAGTRKVRCHLPLSTCASTHSPLPPDHSAETYYPDPNVAVCIIVLNIMNTPMFWDPS